MRLDLFIEKSIYLYTFSIPAVLQISKSIYLSIDITVEDLISSVGKKLFFIFYIAFNILLYTYLFHDEGYTKYFV